MADVTSRDKPIRRFNQILYINDGRYKPDIDLIIGIDDIMNSSREDIISILSKAPAGRPIYIDVLAYCYVYTKYGIKMDSMAISGIDMIHKLPPDTKLSNRMLNIIVRHDLFILDNKLIHEYESKIYRLIGKNNCDLTSPLDMAKVAYTRPVMLLSRYIERLSAQDFEKFLPYIYACNHRPLTPIMIRASKVASKKFIRSNIVNYDWAFDKLLERKIINMYDLELIMRYKPQVLKYFTGTWHSGKNAKYFYKDALIAFKYTILALMRAHVPYELIHAIIEISVSDVNYLQDDIQPPLLDHEGKTISASMS